MSFSNTEVVDTVETGPAVEWDINDPSLAEAIPDVDPEAIPEFVRLAPPSDGYHWVKARLNPNRKGGSVYIKGVKGPDGRIIDGKVVAAVDCKVVDRETGQEGAFLKTWYPTSMVMKGQKGSQLTALCYIAGKPITSGASLLSIKNHVEQIFADAGEDGITLVVKTRWVKSVPQVHDIGGQLEYVLDAQSRKVYVEVKGEEKIKKAAALEGIEPEKAHLFSDPKSGEERSVGAEVQELANPELFTE